MKPKPDQVLLKFAQAQSEPQPFQPTNKKEMALVILLSPLIALGGWIVLLILCMKEGN
tara:strand:- start:285 stop:458 length:174 start_codon:yes stop_codon:yes gene_type:complete